MTSVRRALALSFVERYVLILLALASNVILARLLTPTEIGLYSVTIAAIGLAHALRDFGIGNFLIQERQLNEDHVRTAFGLSLLLGTSLFALLWALAPWAATFYEEPAMVPLMRVVALNFLLLPFCTISLALLRREMEFKKLLWVNVAAAVGGFSITVGLALLGHGPMSLAVGSVAGNLLTGAGAWLARGGKRVLTPSLRLWRQVGSFGGKASLVGLTGAVSADFNDLVVGKLLGFSAVAMINRAMGVMQPFQRDFTATVRGVMQPAYARDLREGRDPEDKYVQSVVLLAALGWPFYAFVAVFPLETLRLLFGSQWDAAAPLVPWMCAAGALAVLNSMIPTLLLARGAMNQLLLLHLLIDPARIVCFLVALLLAPAILTYAVVFFAFYAISVPVAYAIKQGVQPTAFGSLGARIWPSAKAALVPAAAALLWATALRGEDGTVPLAAYLVAGPFYAALWVAMLFAVRHPLTREERVRRWLYRLRGVLSTQGAAQ